MRIMFQNILNDLDHPQPKTPIHCNNATAMGITNNTVKQQCSCLMEMRFFWVGYKVAQDIHNLSWHPGQKSLADFQSKHHPGAHYVTVWPRYLHMENSPLVLPQALAPSNRKGCVGTLKDGYLGKLPLLRAPRIQIPEHVTASAVIRNTHITCYSQVPGVGMVQAWVGQKLVKSNILRVFFVDR